jgi:hypothetical protein
MLWEMLCLGEDVLVGDMSDVVGRGGVGVLGVDRMGLWGWWGCLWGGGSIVKFEFVCNCI